MKALYGARCMRWDLLHPICTLAREVTKWNRNCDLRLHKLMCYIKQSVKYSQEAFCGDLAQQLHLMVYVDASFADCVRTNKSTSGCLIALAGPNTFVPIAAICKKQTCVSHSSTESEIIAAELGLRTEALPLLTLWDLVVEVMHGKAPNEGVGGPNPQRSRRSGSGGEFACNGTLSVSVLHGSTFKRWIPHESPTTNTSSL